MVYMSNPPEAGMAGDTHVPGPGNPLSCLLFRLVCMAKQQGTTVLWYL